MLELGEWEGEEAGLDGFFELGDLVQGGFPVYGEDLGGEFAPGCAGDFVVVCALYELSISISFSQNLNPNPNLLYYPP